MRFLTTSQIARLFFGGSRSATNKRLRKLYDRGYVRVWVRSLAEENIYSVVGKAMNLLRQADAGLTATAARSVPRGVDKELDNLLAINQVRICLALGLAADGGEISRWQSDWELRRHGRASLTGPRSPSLRQGRVAVEKLPSSDHIPWRA